jgi:vancomycin resistance protein YoaR
MRAVTYPQRNSLSLLEQILVAILAGCIVGLGLLIAFGIGVQIWFAGRIMPGVSVGSFDLSGMSPNEAINLLNEDLKYPQEGRILLKEGDHTWLVSPMQMGFFLDPESSAQAALKVGRQGNITQRINTQWNNWRSGQRISPIFVYDERIAYLQIEQLASQINIPVVEADLSLNGTEVIVNSGQIGRTVNIEATLEQLHPLMASMQDGIVEMVVEETPPYILDPIEQAELAKRILSQPLVLTAENAPGSPWQFDPETLAAMLRIERMQDETGSNFQIGINGDLLRQFLTNLAPNLTLAPENALFIFNDETRELEVIQNAVIGRTVDVDGTIQAIQEKIVEEGSHEVPLVFITNKPQITDDVKGADLGITELVHSETSYYYGSSRDRVQNISVAASKFHGIMVPPGATFSMAEALGDISLDNGYAEALIIAGGQTITGVGGGVCQVSTTLFRAVFFAGFPINERYSHAYRVSYYERVAGGGRDPRLAGLDATVYVPVVDFKFTNNTPHWLLMETYVNPTYSSIEWKFYSTSDGRSVDWTTTGPYNLVDPPEPKYKENPDLNEGEIKQVDYAAEGADVNVVRTVTRNGEVLINDTFFTHYQAWQAVFEYGPGTEIPTDNADD